MDLLILRLDGPLQAWGGVAMDPHRPTRSFPSCSALAGLLASALGWRYRDGDRTTALQDALHYAVREDRPPIPLRDYQTADLGGIGKEGWTRWGLEQRGGGTAATGTHILEKHYLAGGVFTVALGLAEATPVPLRAVGDALRLPARPLFLGRKGCPPASRLLGGMVTAPSPYDALEQWPTDSEADPPLRCWYADGEGPPEGEPLEVADRRDFVSDRFAGTRTVREYVVSPPPDPRKENV
jgi:CRISPR system Cascade subunit CasD